MLTHQRLHEIEDGVTHVWIGIRPDGEDQLSSPRDGCVSQHRARHQLARGERLTVHLRSNEEQRSVELAFRAFDTSQPINHAHSEAQGGFVSTLANYVHAIRFVPGRFEVTQVGPSLDDHETDRLVLLTAIAHPAL